MRAVRRAAALMSIATTGLAAAAAGQTLELPPAPERYFNDHAGLVSSSDAERLEGKLQAFDRETSSQVVVVVYPKLAWPSLEDFTIRAAQSWRVGRKKLDNGVVLFVFVEDRRMRLEVGYGLEGALPDAVAKRIVEDRIGPRFRTGDFAGGLEAGIDAIVAATRGEYTAEAARPREARGGGLVLAIFLFFVAGFLFLGRRLTPRPRTYARRGWHDAGFWAWSGGWGGGRGSRRWGGSSGGWGGGGFGGFSGGGGSFGGGGASGSW